MESSLPQRRSNRGRHPKPPNPANAASPPILAWPSEFESQRRSESARKGWDMRRTRLLSETVPQTQESVGPLHTKQVSPVHFPLT